MELTILNENLESTGILDTFESLIWTDRYYGAGDFEVTKSPNSLFAQTLTEGQYVTLKESDHIMEIDYINIHSETGEGTKAIIKGISLEASLLYRRIVWFPTILTGNFQSGILQLLDENVVNPIDPSRKLSLFEYEASEDPVITSLTIDSQFWGEFVYDVIRELCVSRGIGFKITLTDLGKLRFKLYSGVDRTYDQFDNPPIVFSPSFENLMNSDYVMTNRLLKTTTLVAGEQGVGNARTTKTVTVPDGAGSDLTRREMFTDAKGVTRNVPNETPLTDEEYLAQLEQKGTEDLAKNIFIQNFDGQINIPNSHIYGEDYFMGDILEIANEYGHEAKSRVVELIRSQDPSGIKIYPTFGAV